MSAGLQKVAFVVFTGSGSLATLLMIVAVATPRWIEVSEKSFKNSLGSAGVQVSMETYSGLWQFCYTIVSFENPEDTLENCETISYRDLRLQLQYESFLQPLVTFSLINNFKMGMPMYMTSLGFLIIANVVSLFQNANRIFLPFINAILLIFSSLLLSMGCIYFIGAVDFEGLNDKVVNRPVQYRFGYGFKLVWVSFLLENLAIGVNVYLWMSYRSEELKHQRENLASFKTIAMQMVPLGRSRPLIAGRGSRSGGGDGGGGGGGGGSTESSAGQTGTGCRHSCGTAASVEPANEVEDGGQPGSQEQPQAPRPQQALLSPQRKQQQPAAAGVSADQQQQNLEQARRHWAFLKNPAKLSRLEQKRADSLARQVMVRATTK